jgi:hypothetical protein
MKEFFNNAVKIWILALGTGIFIGGLLGSTVERTRIYGDCRYAGVTRMDEVAFKCEQFSKVVLLTPDELAKKVDKK